LYIGPDAVDAGVIVGGPMELHLPAHRGADRTGALAKPVRVVRSVEQGPLPFTEDRASPALRGQGYHSMAVFTTRLWLNDIILLE
jgi:hypothetical protein